MHTFISGMQKIVQVIPKFHRILSTSQKNDAVYMLIFDFTYFVPMT